MPRQNLSRVFRDSALVALCSSRRLATAMRTSSKAELASRNGIHHLAIAPGITRHAVTVLAASCMTAQNAMSMPLARMTSGFESAPDVLYLPQSHAKQLAVTH